MTKDSVWRRLSLSQEAQPKSASLLDSWIFHSATSNLFHRRGGERQIEWSLCSFFLSSSKGFSRLGYRGGECRGRIGGGGPGSPSSNFHIQVCFFFYLSPVPWALWIWYLCWSDSADFLWEHMVAHTLRSNAGWLQWMRKELTGWYLKLLWDYTISYLSVIMDPGSLSPPYWKLCEYSRHLNSFVVWKKEFLNAQPHLQ